MRNEIPTSVRVACCYFGELPPYMQLVLKSMAFNPTVDWLLVTDANVPWVLPSNIVVRQESFESMRGLMGKAIGEDVRIEAPKDLSQFKPFFGMCFPEEFAGYEFWGHHDLDMIFGDLRAFIPESVFQEHDRIFSRGHLCLYRNVPRVHQAFKLMAPGALSYKDAIAKKAPMPFDEWEGAWKIFRYHNIPQYHRECIADIKAPSGTLIPRFEAYELANHKHQFFYWHKGKVYQAYHHREGGIFDEEVAYIHFQKRQLPAPDFEATEVDGFSIGPLGFRPYHRENLQPWEMDELNPERRIPWGRLTRLRERLSLYLRHLFKLTA